MPVRLKDIASDLNLSQMTISRVLRGQTDVSPETKARVLQRAKELNYRPNAMARSLRTGHTSTMGLIVPSFRDAYVSELVRGIDEVLRPAGYELMVCVADNDPELEQRHIELLLAHQVDALLLMSTQESVTFFEGLGGRHTVPIILINRRFKEEIENSSVVGIREEDVGRLAVEHLVSVGCRRIAYLRGPRSSVGDLRYSGFREALNSAGLAHRTDWVIDGMGAEGTEYKRGFEGINQLLSKRPYPDGLIAYSDMMAVGAIDAALAREIRIPEGIAFVGSGNEARICDMRVPLSSIDTAGYQLGQRAGRIAWRKIRGDATSSARKILVTPKLVQRRSSMR